MKQSTLLLILSFFLIGLPAWSASNITLQGRLLKPDGVTPITGNVSFRIQIRSPGAENCLLYEETNSFNTTSSAGLFSLTVGSGTRSAANVDGGYPMEQIFGNKAELDLSGAPGACDGGFTSYAPAATDGRKLVYSFNDGSGWQTVPTLAVNWVPMAFEAYSVGGFAPDHIFRVEDALGNPSVIAALTPAQAAELLALSLGTSTTYVTPGSASFTAAPTYGGAVSNANHLTNKAYVDNAVSTAIGDFDGDDIVTGTIGGNTAVNTSGNIVTTGVVSAAELRGSTLRIYNGANYVQFTAPALSGTDVAFVLPDNDGDPGQVLRTDGAGNLSWISPSTGSVTSVAASAPLSSTGGATPTISISQATTTTNGYLTSTDWNTFNDKLGATTVFAGDISGDYDSISVDKIKGVGVDYTVTPASGHVLRHDGTNWVPATLAAGDIPNIDASKITAGTLPVARGGTGATSFNADAVIISNVTGTALTSLNCTSGQLIKFGATGNAYCAADIVSNGTEFVQGGNTFGAAAILGTNDNQPLHFETNATNKMTILANGNIGIGTSTPGENFHIYNDTNSLTGAIIESTVAGNNAESQLSLRAVGSRLDISSWPNVSVTTVGGHSTVRLTSLRAMAGDRMIVGTHTARPLYLMTNNATRMTFDDVGNVGIGTISPNATSLLDLSSTTKGLLIPRMTTAQRDAIATPATGLQVYNTSTNQLNYYDGSSWQMLNTGSGSSGDVAGPAASTDNAIARFDATTGKIIQNSTLVLNDTGDLDSADNFYVSAPTIRLQATNPTNSYYFQVPDGTSRQITFGDNHGGWPFAYFDLKKTSGNNNEGNFEIRTHNNDNQLFLAGEGAIAGNVGLGTDTPSSRLDVNGAITTRGIAAPTVSPSGQGRIYFDSTDNKFKVSQNGAAYTDLVSGGGGASSSGTAGHVQFSDGSGGFSSDANQLFWNATNDRLGINTTTPEETLHVRGTMKLGMLMGWDSGADLQIAGAASGSYMQLGSNTNDLLIGTTTTVAAIRSTTGDLHIKTGCCWNGHPVAAGVTRMAVTQSGNIGIGTSSPVATALLDLTSTEKGLLIPRMTTTQRDAIATPATGLQVYNTSTNQLNYYNGSSWQAVSTGSGGSGDISNGGNAFGSALSIGTNDNFAMNLVTNGTSKMTILEDGKVGIGTGSPSMPLQINHGTANATNAIRLEVPSGNSSKSHGIYLTENGTVRGGYYLVSSGGSAGQENIIDAGNGGSLVISADAFRGEYRFDVPNGATRRLRFRSRSGGYNAADIVVTKTAGSNDDGTMLLKTTGHSVDQLYLDAVGNVGVGTSSPKSTLQVNGYVQLALTSAAPPAVDCDHADERGRMMVDNVNGVLYICMNSGWVAK